MRRKTQRHLLPHRIAGHRPDRAALGRVRGNYIQTTVTTACAVVTQMQPITVIFPIPERSGRVLPQLNKGAPLEVFAYAAAAM